MIEQVFYNGAKTSMIDVVARGTLMNKTKPWWTRRRKMLTTSLRRWRSTITNHPMRRLLWRRPEVNLMLMPWLCLLLKWMSFLKGLIVWMLRCFIHMSPPFLVIVVDLLTMWLWIFILEVLLPNSLVTKLHISITSNLYSNTYNSSWRTIPTYHIEVILFPFPKPTLGPHLPIFKDLTSLYKSHESLTYRLCWRAYFWHNKTRWVY